MCLSFGNVHGRLEDPQQPVNAFAYCLCLLSCWARMATRKIKSSRLSEVRANPVGAMLVVGARICGDCFANQTQSTLSSAASFPTVRERGLKADGSSPAQEGGPWKSLSGIFADEQVCIAVEDERTAEAELSQRASSILRRNMHGKVDFWKTRHVVWYFFEKVVFSLGNVNCQCGA